MPTMNEMPLEKCVAINEGNPAVYYATDLCKKCGLCKRTCNAEIGVSGYFDLAKTGGNAICIHCGQCASACPFGVIKEVSEVEAVKDALADPEKVVVVTTAPAVRAALGECFGMEPGTFVEGKMVSLLRKLGFDYVLDTDFAADLTIMEEGSELVSRLTKGTGALPMFTSCCPGWVKFAEYYYPELLPNLSSAKSPISMMGALMKSYFAAKAGVDPEKIVHVALTPCTAKKFEIRREELEGTDICITTRELGAWANSEGVDFTALEDGAYDKFMGESTGAGVIFGNTGGVMEAALRSAYFLVTGEAAPAEFFHYEPVRGLTGVKEATVKLGDAEVNIAVIMGTQNARVFLDGLKKSGKTYHFIEVMTCQGGCIGGGGQPVNIRANKVKVREARTAALYANDEAKSLRVSYENPEIKAIYADFLGAPLGEKSEELLHTHYTDRSKDLGE